MFKARTRHTPTVFMRSLMRHVGVMIYCDEVVILDD